MSFRQYELVFLSFPVQNAHQTLLPPFGTPWARPKSTNRTSIPNPKAHISIVLYVLIMSRTHFRVNPYSIFA